MNLTTLSLCSFIQGGAREPGPTPHRLFEAFRYTNVMDYKGFLWK